MKKPMKETTRIHLILKGTWYDMIASGEKKEEYREGKEYWEKRIWNVREIIRTIVFHRGYNGPTMEVECNGIDIGFGKEEWGAVPGKIYYVISLGKVIGEGDTF
ncbi:MAG: hypothetical protein K6A41_04165 [Bacteroidales bacterium]|nr:hypothetical protein [Bacteroidales bacterium]